jgi:hypothetical protein
MFILIRVEVESLIAGSSSIRKYNRGLFSLIRIRTIKKVRKPSNSVCYTPSSEPYRIYIGPGSNAGIKINFSRRSSERHVTARWSRKGTSSETTDI